MIAFPVLERWLRGKVGIKDRELKGTDGERFYGELVTQFQALRDPEACSFPRVAKHFWQTFRHGILSSSHFFHETNASSRGAGILRVRGPCW